MCFSTLILSSLHWLPADFRSHFYIYINIYFNSRLAPAGGLSLKLGVTELFSTKTESIESAEQSHLQTFLFLYSVLFEIIFSVFFLVFFYHLINCISYEFIVIIPVVFICDAQRFVTTCLWKTLYIYFLVICSEPHVCHIHVFCCFNPPEPLCWCMLCITRSYSNREVSGHKLVRVVCNAVWRFLREVFHLYASFAEITTQIQRSLWNHSETHLMWWTGYRTPLCYFLSVPEK